jgi:UDP-N-acetylmuramoyl-tripeptide--D-alanyl-D-alanine ligase
MHINELYSQFLESTGIATDTRAIEKGKLFFALKGVSFNGNKFADQAIEAGALFAIIDEKEYKTTDRHILVDNVLETLQGLAACHRSKFKIPVIGVTGSNGKTTTKELINAVLSTKFNVFATKGNFNNHIGVPLSLLSITKETEIAIIEMGANHMGEIASYCKWVKPTLGLITNIGHAHLEGFGSFENIIKAKSELYDELKETNKIIFYNDDDELIKSLLSDYVYKISYGREESVDTQVKVLNSFPTVQLTLVEEGVVQAGINTHLFGEYNASNLSAALAIASYFNIPFDFIKAGLEDYVPKNNRSEIRQLGTNLVILDAYNANPTSVEAAVDSFSKLAVAQKVVMIGDMFELGKDAFKLHQGIVDFVCLSKFDKTIFVGKEFCKCVAENALFFETTQDAKKWFLDENLNTSTILIKGSRGMKMESIID